MEDVVSGVRQENKRLVKELDFANLRMGQCDQELEQASEQLGRLAREVAYVTAKNEKFANLESENALLKGDIARVLRLLEYLAPKDNSDAKLFLSSWKESEGLSFIGLPKGRISGIGSAHAASTQPQRPASNKDDDDEDYPEPPPFSDDLDNASGGIDSLPTPDEVDALREAHGGDPFPLTSSLREESESWVPHEAALNGFTSLSSIFCAITLL
jgi:hypothetical protein